ncbi:unnamed protein product [Durusdinium trenchii]|uniref:Uncharacterized protein n=1 Tax=Durusdinium trenchii TaxID=1381693 RepID=A0ABP0IUA1_9DINO
MERYISFQHTSTVASIQFNDTFLLKPSALIQAIQENPESCSYVYQYARKLQAKLNSEETHAAEHLPDEEIEECSEATDVYQLRHLSKEKLLVYFEVPTENTSQEEILAFIEDVMSGKICEGAHILHELARLFPELTPENGTHAVFTSDTERHRALSCMISVLWLASNNYEEFSHCQPGSKKLQPQLWSRLQDFVHWVGIKEKPQWIHGTLVYLAVKGLGRSKSLALQLPVECQTPDKVVCRLLENYMNVVPSAQYLDPVTHELVTSISKLHISFVFGQFMQAENTPLSLQILRQRAAEHDDAAYKLFLFSALTGLAGIGAGPGTSGSPFLIEPTTLTVLHSLQALQKLQLRSSQERHEAAGYLCHWGRSLALSTHTLEDLAFLRLACICRTRARAAAAMGERTALEMAFSSWCSLSLSERQALTETRIWIYGRLRQCTQEPQGRSSPCRATELPVAVGLASMLVLLVELVEITWTQLGISVLPHQVEVNLVDLAAFTAAVRSRSVFFSCLENARINHSGNSGYVLNMTSKNWSRTEEVSNHDLAVSSAMRAVLRAVAKPKREETKDTKLTPLPSIIENTVVESMVV